MGDNSEELAVDHFKTALKALLDNPSAGTSRCKCVAEDASYFPDGSGRRIDYVLAYACDEETNSSNTVNKEEPNLKSSTRRRFHRNLQNLGLQIMEVKRERDGGETQFVLIHAPFEVLAARAEKMRLVKEILTVGTEWEREVVEGVIDRFLKRFSLFTLSDEIRDRVDEQNYFKAPFNRRLMDCYVGAKDSNNFFTGSERSMMVYDILARTDFGKKKYDASHIGIDRLINNETYTAAHPLHQKINSENPSDDVNDYTDRELLKKYWGTLRMVQKYQPICLVKKYFGAKIAIYFSLLGFYTKILGLASLVGLLCFIYSAVTVGNDVPSNDICRAGGIGSQTIMCPLCQGHCDFFLLQSNCLYSKIAYLFDNLSTVFFSVVMCIGVTIFLKGYKRFYAEREWQWGLLDFETDEGIVRADYDVHVRSMQAKRIDVRKEGEEPYIPLEKRLPRFVQSTVTVLFLLCLMLAFVLGIILFRTIFLHCLYATADFKKYARIVASASAASINAVFILLFSYVYAYIARKLTNREYPRTDEDFEKSYAFKLYLFQVVSRYSSLFYIAFVKDNLAPLPGQKVLGLQPERCEYGGCMLELSIQLAVIMAVVQTFKFVKKMCQPHFARLLQQPKLGIKALKEMLSAYFGRREQSSIPRFELDYGLAPFPNHFTIEGYIEIMLQFGILMLFGAAFSLAPLFALIFNAVLIRLEARNCLCHYRRPHADRSTDIEIWLYIIEAISRVSAITNAFILAFTSEFIPRLVYTLQRSHEGLQGYVDYSLSTYDASPFHILNSTFYAPNITHCRYRGYRYPPCDPTTTKDCKESYGPTTQWWIILSARIGFAFAYVVMILLIKATIDFWVPDVPSKIEKHLKKQRALGEKARLNDMRPAEGSRSDLFNNPERFLVAKLDSKTVRKRKTQAKPQPEYRYA